LDRTGVFESTGVFDRTGVFESTGVLESTGVFDRTGILVDNTGVFDSETLERAAFDNRVAPSTGFAVAGVLADLTLPISDFFWMATSVLLKIVFYQLRGLGPFRFTPNTIAI
jgi:hypothetical protein